MQTSTPDNSRPALLLFILYFCFGTAYVATDTAAYLLFIQAIGSESLPLTYLGIALALSLFGIVYLRLERQIPLRRLMLMVSGLLIVVTLGWVFGQSMNPATWLIFLMPVWSYALINICNVITWNLAGTILNVRQSKRQYGLINGGRWLAATITGLLAAPLVSAFGSVSLFMLALIALIAAFAIVFNITQQLPDSQAAAPTHTAPSTSSADKQKKLWEQPFVRALSGGVLGFILILFLTNNIFYEVSARNFVDEESLAQAIGTTTTLAGLLALGLNVFAVGPIMKRFGLQTSLYISPLVSLVFLIVTTIALLVNAPIGVLFALTALTRVMTLGTSFSIDYSTSRVAFQALPLVVRSRLNTIIEGFIEPTSIAVSGFLLIALQSAGLDYRLQVFLVLAAAVIWIWRVNIISRLYPQAIERALKRRAFRDEGLILDASSMTVLHETLKSPYPEAVLYALDLLEEAEDPELNTAVITLLDYPSPAIKRQALELVEKRDLQTALPKIRQLLENETDLAVRERLLQTLASMGDTTDFERVVTLLDDTSLRRGAMIGLIQSGRLDGIIFAGEKILHLVDSPLGADRQTAAEVLGNVGIRNYYQPILRLMDDPDTQVRLAALAAAGKIHHPRLWDGITAALVLPETRTTALDALIEGSEHSLPYIQTVLIHPETSEALRLLLLRACSTINHPNTVAILEKYLSAEDLTLRSQVLSSLRSKNYRPASTEQVTAQIESEITQAVSVLAAHAALSSVDAADLLCSGLWQDFHRLRDNTLVLLSFIHPAQPILKARETLLYGSDAQQNYALEVLDTVLPADIRRYVLALWEPLSTSERLRRLASQFVVPEHAPHEWLQKLAAYPHDWIRTCAAYTADKLDNTLGSYDTKLINHVILLKQVGIFAGTPDAVLAEVASTLQSVTLTAGEVLFEKGDLGSSLYIVARGKMRVYDGDFTFEERRDGSAFGEMALLDPEPRSASVMAMVDSDLLRLDQAAFYELMAGRVEIVRGMLRVLIGSLRMRVRDLAVLREELNGDQQQTQLTETGVPGK